MVFRKGLRLILLALLLGLSSMVVAGEETVAFLVRHAEKVKTGTDPALSAAGMERATTLADLLAGAGITHIHSSNTTRTRSTAAPLASRLQLEVTLYDPRQLASLAERLRKTPGRHLIVGHSNTTPELVGHLGGVAGDPIDEAGEYNRLYIVTLSAEEPSQTIVLRYGVP